MVHKDCKGKNFSCFICQLYIGQQMPHTDRLRKLSSLRITKGAAHNYDRKQNEMKNGL